MRALLSLVLAVLVAAPLLACDQDYAASNENRESFMGKTHAAGPWGSASVAASTPPPAASAH